MSWRQITFRITSWHCCVRCLVQRFVSVRQRLIQLTVRREFVCVGAYLKVWEILNGLTRWKVKFPQYIQWWSPSCLALAEFLQTREYWPVPWMPEPCPRWPFRCSGRSAEQGPSWVKRFSFRCNTVRIGRVSPCGSGLCLRRFRCCRNCRRRSSRWMRHSRRTGFAGGIEIGGLHSFPGSRKQAPGIQVAYPRTMSMLLWFWWFLSLAHWKHMVKC